MFQKNLVRTSVTLDKEDFQLFKQLCKINNSDASKTLRAFIEEYISKNQQTVMKMKTNW